ncbi:MAG: Glu-tRNA(Gln) amidotransferase subunit GatD [Candidatus Nanoarchaeia archaeon]
MKKKNLSQGSHYKVELNDGSFQEGVFISETEDFLFLKLGSGYNIGIAKKNIEEIEQTKEAHLIEKKEKKEHNVFANPDIMILHTGGTIASKVDYSTGAVSAKFSTEDLLELFPELKTLAVIDSRLISNMLSENINFSHYNKMAQAIEESLERSLLKGIILTHGTDTLHYTASALSFMFENLPIPVILVGSQRSSDRPSSDSAMNLLSAAFFITKAKEHNINGVFVCMHESNDDDYCTILPAQNVRKLHSSRRDAFKAVNSAPVARVNFEKKKIEILNNNSEEKIGAEKKLMLFNPEIKIGIIRSRPGMYAEELKVYEKFDGLILEGTGLGHFPIESFDKETEENKEIFEELKKLASKKIVGMTSQTVFGRINMNVYSPGRMLKEAGVLGHNLDMTTETAYIKLAWLLSNYDKEEAKRLYSENLRGEISERTEKEEFL